MWDCALKRPVYLEVSVSMPTGIEELSFQSNKTFLELFSTLAKKLFLKTALLAKRNDQTLKVQNHSSNNHFLKIKNSKISSMVDLIQRDNRNRLVTLFEGSDAWLRQMEISFLVVKRSALGHWIRATIGFDLVSWTGFCSINNFCSIQRYSNTHQMMININNKKTIPNEATCKTVNILCFQQCRFL